MTRGHARWNVGTDVQANTALLQGEGSPYPLYLCGEVLSRTPGWVEGALESADRLVETYFATPEAVLPVGK